MKAQLDAAWLKRDKLRAEGSKLRAEGNKLYAKGDKLRAEGSKLYAEGDRLYAEGDRLYAEGRKLYAEVDKLRAEGDKLHAERDKLHAEGALVFIAEVIRLCGKDALIEWDVPGEGDCTVQGVMVFYKIQTKGRIKLWQGQKQYSRATNYLVCGRHRLNRMARQQTT